MSSSTSFAVASTTAPSHLWQTRPADAPPPGVTPNLNASNFRGIIYVVLAIFAMVLSTGLVSIRYYTKAILTNSVGWDDHTCLLSLICALVFSGATIKLSFLGMGRHIWDVRQTYGERQTYNLNQFVSDEIYFAAIGLVKVSMLLLYLRTFLSTRRKLRYLGFGLIAVVLLSHFLVIFLDLIVSPHLYCNWKHFFSDEAYERLCPVYFDDTDYYFAVNCFTIVLDIVILIIPSRVVWKLQVPRKQKIMLLGIVFAGVLVTLASILRLVYAVQLVFLPGGIYDDDTMFVFNSNIASLIEMHLAIACICLPTLKAFIKVHAPVLLGTSLITKRTTNASQSRKGPQPSTFNATASSRRWKTDSHEEELIGHPFTELEDPKDNQVYVMTTIDVQSDAPNSLGAENSKHS